MRTRCKTLIVWLLAAPALLVSAQQPASTSSDASMPHFVHDRDPLEHRIDMFLSAWQWSMPRSEHGSLVLRDILTRGDNFAPPQIGATLQYANFLAFGRLAAGAWTTPSVLDRQQEIFYITGGEGQITAAGETVPLHKDIAVLVPAGLSFVLSCSGPESLTMYVLNEPVSGHFHPASHLLARDESALPLASPMHNETDVVAESSSTPSPIVHSLFTAEDGLATESRIVTVTLPPGAIVPPHAHRPGHEEIWAQIEGTSTSWLGAELRTLKPGMAYMLRPDGTTTHSNVNPGTAPVKFLAFVRVPDYAPPVLNHGHTGF